MEILIQILAIACVTTLTLATNWYEGTWFNRKPFNCALCAASWIAMPIFIWQFGWIAGFAYSAIAGVVAELLDRNINLR